MLLRNFLQYLVSPASVGVTVTQQDIDVSNPPLCIWQQLFTTTQETGKNRGKITM